MKVMGVSYRGKRTKRLGGGMRKCRKILKGDYQRDWQIKSGTGGAKYRQEYWETRCTGKTWQRKSLSESYVKEGKNSAE